jgi:hypothetical protein
VTDAERDDPFRPEDWLTAAETIRLVRTETLSPTSHIAIATRAHAGLLRARADLFIVGEERRTDCEVPAKFWWATGHDALTQNWETGDFETWVDRRFHLRAFGVRFLRDDLRKMIPGAFPANVVHVAASEPPKSAGGRNMSALWPDWIAELVATIHDDGIPGGCGTEGADQLIPRSLMGWPRAAWKRRGGPPFSPPSMPSFVGCAAPETSRP